MDRFLDIFSPYIGSGGTLVFNTLNFWLFFILVLAVFSMLHKQKLVRSIFLTVVSAFVYFKTSGLFLLILILSITVNYFFGRNIYKARSDLRRKWIIAFSAIFNVFLLGYFKYALFFTQSFNELFHTDYEVINHFIQYGKSWFGDGLFAETSSSSLIDRLILPIGVSFFTFQNISYTVDIYRKEIEPVKNFFHYSFFVSFFPQLVMGPIIRARDFIPQISKPFQLDKQSFSWSIIQIMKGLTKKMVIGDFLLQNFINQVTIDPGPEAYPGFVSIIAMWAYSLHIYADFSGYTDIAIGVSRLLGFEIKENFKSPYKATSVADFWRRWHKSLGAWLRDYLYIPLGGNRGGTFGSYLAIFVIFIFLIFITGWYELVYLYCALSFIYIIGLWLIKDFQRYVHRDLNLIITMVVGGLWHGASENFVIWGAMNGLALIIYKYWSKVSFYEKSRNWISHFWKIFITFNFITLTRIWFKLNEGRHHEFDGQLLTKDQADALPSNMLDHIWSSFLSVKGIPYTWIEFVEAFWNYQAVFWIMVIGFIIHWLPDKVKGIYESAFTKMPIPVQAVVVAILVFMIYQAVPSGEAPLFVYTMF